MQVQLLSARAITIACYENHVPPFVGAVMDRLYQSLFSSLSLYRIYDTLDTLSTYVVRDEGRVIALFLFRLEPSRVMVCNEVIRVSTVEVNRFAEYIFARYARIRIIAFRAVENDIDRLSYPFQRFNTLEDIVLTLPSSVDQYLASLGKATRRTIRNQMNRLLRAYPTFRFVVSETSQIDESDIHAIVRMNQARMAGKDKVSSYDAEEVQRICRLARVCGLVGIVMMDGRVCAGAVSFRVGEHYFMSISAHNPDYDDFRLGTLCGFLNICECIRRGGQECHLLWGRHEYKYRFLGVQRELDNLTIYRSGFAMLRHCETVLTMAVKGNFRRAQRWLQKAKRCETLAWRSLMLLSNARRRLLASNVKRS